MLGFYLLFFSFGFIFFICFVKIDMSFWFVDVSVILGFINRWRWMDIIEGKVFFFGLGVFV